MEKKVKRSFANWRTKGERAMNTTYSSTTTVLFIKKFEGDAIEGVHYFPPLSVLEILFDKFGCKKFTKDEITTILCELRGTKEHWVQQCGEDGIIKSMQELILAINKYNSSVVETPIAQTEIIAPPVFTMSPPPVLDIVEVPAQTQVVETPVANVVETPSAHVEPAAQVENVVNNNHCSLQEEPVAPPVKPPAVKKIKVQTVEKHLTVEECLSAKTGNGHVLPFALIRWLEEEYNGLEKWNDLTIETIMNYVGSKKECLEICEVAIKNGFTKHNFEPHTFETSYALENLDAYNQKNKEHWGTPCVPTFQEIRELEKLEFGEEVTKEHLQNNTKPRQWFVENEKKYFTVEIAEAKLDEYNAQSLERAQAYAERQKAKKNNFENRPVVVDLATTEELKNLEANLKKLLVEGKITEKQYNQRLANYKSQLSLLAQKQAKK